MHRSSVAAADIQGVGQFEQSAERQFGSLYNELLHTPAGTAKETEAIHRLI